jgi:hypothetical protein
LIIIINADEDECGTLVERYRQDKTIVLGGKNLFQRHFAYQKSDMDWPGIEIGLPS